MFKSLFLTAVLAFGLALLAPISESADACVARPAWGVSPVGARSRHQGTKLKSLSQKTRNSRATKKRMRVRRQPAPVVAAKVPPAQDQTSGSRLAGKAHVLTLNITYAARIRVPSGSLLNIRLSDAHNRKIEELAVRTQNDSGPYAIRVNVPATTVYPLRGAVLLTSTAGHRMRADVEITESGPAGVDNSLSISLRNDAN